MQKTKRTTGIRAKVKFYNWAVKTGIDLKNFEPEKLEFELSKPKSSFKNRPNEIKQNFNHVFKMKPEPTDSFKDFPNIDKMTFVPVGTNN